jgi:L-malate glycosyltransferase
MPANKKKIISLAICSTGEIYGGVEQFVYTFSNYLKKETEVHFIVVLFNRGLLYDKLNEAGIETYLCLGHKYNPFIIKQLARLFKENKINIVHTHGYKANILCSIAAKMSNARIVTTEHGRQEPSKGFGFLKMFFNLFLDKLVRKYMCGSIVFVSKDIQRSLSKTYKNKKQCVIYNGIPEISIHKNIRLSDFDYNIFNIGIVGRLSKVKGHIYLIKAIKRLSDLKDIRLNIFGEGSLEEELKSYCIQNSLTDRIKFMGFKENIHDYIPALDLFVMPSFHEGLPYTILEAMYLNVPIIASNVGGLQEIVENNVDGILVPPGDENKIQKAIGYLYNNPKERTRLADNAFKIVTEHFLIDQMAKNYLNVYKDLIESN